LGEDELAKQRSAVEGASNRANPDDADPGRSPQPIDELSSVMLNVPNIVELQLQFAERQPMES